MRILSAGLAAGLLLNVLGWLGNQLLLGNMWSATMHQVVPLRSRTLLNELVSLVPDFIYGVALAWLFCVLVRSGRSRARAAGQAGFCVWSVGAMTTYLGVWNSGLIAPDLAVATTLLALMTFVPATWLVSLMIPTT